MKSYFRSVTNVICAIPIVFGFCLGGKIAYAEIPTEIPEYQVKATFLLNFGKLTTFPDDFNNASQMIDVCVLGDDPFHGTLDVLIKDEQIQQRSVKLHYINRSELSRTCHILFVSQSEQQQVVNILAQLKQRPTLTVSDIENFVIRGGMIQLYTMENKIRFFIDPVTANEAGLKINSQLLRLAQIVKKAN